MIAEVEGKLGAIDILVNNAGSLVERLKTAELTEERWDEVFALNVKSAFFARASRHSENARKRRGRDRQCHFDCRSQRRRAGFDSLFSGEGSDDYDEQRFS